MGKSIEREDWGGNKYTEHYDDNGNKIGESRDRVNWAGDKYTEHTDSSGNKAGESRGQVNWAGDKYTEHTDSSGSKIGESRERVNWAGDKYTEHEMRQVRPVERSGTGDHDSHDSGSDSGATYSYSGFSSSTSGSARSSGGRGIAAAVLVVALGVLGAAALLGPGIIRDTNQPAPVGWWIIAADKAGVPADPFAYCSTVRNKEYGEGAYHQVDTSPQLAREFARVVKNNYVALRCVNGDLYGCGFGANGAACEKKNRNTEPTAEMKAFCEDRPESDWIPMVYIRPSFAMWRCRGTMPVIRETWALDERGYVAEYWHKIFR